MCASDHTLTGLKQSLFCSCKPTPPWLTSLTCWNISVFIALYLYSYALQISVLLRFWVTWMLRYMCVAYHLLLQVVAGWTYYWAFRQKLLSNLLVFLLRRTITRIISIRIVLLHLSDYLHLFSSVLIHDQYFVH